MGRKVTQETRADDDAFGDFSLTKREYFAICALQGLLNEWPLTSDHKALTRDAVMFADALIDALNATSK